MSLDAGVALAAAGYGYLAALSNDGGVAALSSRAVGVRNYLALSGYDVPDTMITAGDYGNVGVRTINGVWNDQVTVTAQQFYGAWSGSTEKWVVGLSQDFVSGVIARQTNLQPWASFGWSSPGLSVWQDSSRDTYVGVANDLLRFAPDAGAPVSDALGVNGSVRGIWSAPGFPVTALTDSPLGPIIRSRDAGNNWDFTDLTSLTPAHYDSIHGAALGDGGFEVWIAGEKGNLLHRLYDGGYEVLTMGTQDLFAVFVEADRTWAVGDKGTVLLRTDDAGWSSITVASGFPLRGVWAAPGGDGVWVIGLGNTVLSKIPAR